MKILMVIPALDTGGAEWAFVRLANAMSARHEVTAYVPFAVESRSALLSAFDRAVNLVSLPLPHRWFRKALYKLSLLFPCLDIEQRLHSWVLKSLHATHGFAVINPHLRGATLMVCKAFRHQQVPIVESDHGDYALLNREDPAMTHHQLLLERVDAIACPTKINEVSIRKLLWKRPLKTAVIPNTIPTTVAPPPSQARPFTFGMVARGIAEKGWAEALQAFRWVQKQVSVPLRLVFVGSGDCLDQLQAEVGADESIVFAGYQSQPSNWIARFDVGLLPSYFAGESLPNVISECLAQGKPVIATDVGGIAEMLEGEGGPCGLLVPLDRDSHRADVKALGAAMLRLHNDSELRSRFQNQALIAVQRYSPERCCEAYTSFFSSVINSTSPSA